MREKDRKNGLVYSTEHGRMCPGCGKALAKCECKNLIPLPTGDGIVRVGRETKGRKGSGVTVITGLLVGEDELKKLATMLKNKCGCGGTIKDGIIEIQGDNRDKIIELLKAEGHKTKKSGG